MYGEWKYNSTILNNGDRGKWSVSRPGRSILRESSPGTEWIGGWVGPRTGLDLGEKRISLSMALQPLWTLAAFLVS
jgi:hypothetical protein